MKLNFLLNVPLRKTLITVYVSLLFLLVLSGLMFGKSVPSAYLIWIGLASIGLLLILGYLVFRAAFILYQDKLVFIEKDENLTRQKKMFEDLLMASPDAIVGINEQGAIVLFNRQAEEMFGYSAQEIKGKWIEILMPDRFKKTHTEVRNAYFANPRNRPMGKSQQDFLARRKNGEEFHVDISLNYLQTTSGMIALSSIRDITAKKLMEQELKESRAFSQGILASLSSQIAVIDSTGEILVVNKAWENFALENGAGNLHTCGTGSNYLKACEKAVASGDPMAADALKGILSVMNGETSSFRFQYPCHSPNKKRWFMMKVMDFSGISPGVVISHTDITDLVEAKNQSEESERKFKNIIDTTDEMIDTLSLDGTILWTNRAWRKNLRFTEEDLARGMNIMELISDEEKKRYLEEHKPRLHKGETITGIEAIIKTKNGEEIFVTGTVIPMMVNGEIKGTQGFFRNETKRKKAEDAIRKADLLLKEAQRLALIGSWELDIVNQKLYWSDEIFRIFEIDRTKFSPSYEIFLNAIHPEDRELVNKTYTDSVANKTPYNIVHRLEFSDGRIKYVNEQCETYYDDEGNPVRSIGTVQDITRQKQAETALKESEQKLERVIENISDGLMIDDFSGKVVFANKRFRQLLRLEDKDLENLMLEDYVAPEYRETLRDRHNRRIRGENVPEVFEYVALRKDGERRWFEVRVSPVIENGKIIGTQSALNDITERKENELLLRTREQQLREISSSMPGVIYQYKIDRNGNRRYSYIGENIVLLLGLTAEEVYADSDIIVQRIHPDDLQRVREEMLASRNSPGRFSSHFRVIHAVDGSTKWINSNAISSIDEHDTFTMNGTLLDETDSRMKEDELRKSQELLQEVSSSIPGVVYQFKMNTKGVFSFPYLSEGIKALSGVPRDEVYKNPMCIFNRIYTEDLPSIMESIQSTAVSLEPWTAIFRTEISKGNIRWIRGSSVPKQMPDGSIVWNGTLFDITELKVAEKALEENNAELRKINTELDRFVYSTSHDLRSPLLSLQGVIEMAKETIGGNTQVHDYCDMMLTSVHKIDDTIKEILDYSRNSRMELKPEPLQLKNSIESLIENIRHMKGLGKIDFITDIDESIPFVSDKIRVNALVNNLVTNAAKYSNPEEKHPFVRVKFSVTPEEGILTVEDNGEGIPENKLDKIFEMFYRNSYRSSGSGLGLYICKEIVAKLNGSISVRSTPGEGSTFTVKLPNLNPTI